MDHQSREHQPWLTIPLADYEDHMRAPQVGQAALLADALAALVARLRPPSLAILGAAGGNGLDRIDPGVVRRVGAVDINPDYLAVCSKRYASRFETLITATDDISAGQPAFEPVHLVYAALIAEYVPLPKFAAYVGAAMHALGTLAVILQFPGVGSQVVTPSAYTSLARLAPMFHYVEPDPLTALLQQNNLRRVSSSTVRGPGDKAFALLEFVRN